jgi:hypothetical protein
MDKKPIEERIKLLRWYGFNPIHLWGNVYLVRHMPRQSSDLPFYTIKVFKE